MGNEPTYRFGAAAAAIGISEQALRNWLTRNEVDLFEKRPGGGWRSFSESDIFVLSVTAELVKFGCPVDDAVRIARECLGSMNFATLTDMPQHIWAAPMPESSARQKLRWEGATDYGLLWAYREREPLPGAVQITVPVCLAEARKRLEVKG